MESNSSIPTKSKIPGIKERINLGLIAILIFVSVTSPFWHIFYERGASDGIFGFRTMREFLYSFGTHFILFGCSLFIFWFIYLLRDIDKKLRSIGNVVAGMFCSVSIYYLLYIFVYTSDPRYPDSFYEIAFTTGAVLSSLTIYLIFNYHRVNKLKIIKREAEAKKFEATALKFIDEINKSLLKN